MGNTRRSVQARARRTPASLATHVAYYCEPATCPKHSRPRLHRRARSDRRTP